MNFAVTLQRKTAVKYLSFPAAYQFNSKFRSHKYKSFSDFKIGESGSVITFNIFYVRHSPTERYARS
jgi:hypothetical protein